MTKSRKVASVVAVLLIGGAVAAFGIAWRPSIAAIDPPAPQSFDPALVKRGRELAAIGNCSDCHTVRGGKDFAGGLPVPTPFGTIYSSNITPDAHTGIGRWSEAAFRRAMRSGVNRDGQDLYPTFPYDHFTLVQSMSWTLYESVTFDDRRITSIDWQTYPILRFNSVPDSIEVHIINRPGQPFLGSGETGQGPAAASLR